MIVLGAGGVVGRLLLQLLEEDTSVERVVATAREPLTGLPGKASYFKLDLLDEACIDPLADCIDDCDIDALVYMGYLAGDRTAEERTAEEAQQLIRALGRRPVPKAIFCSSTVVYGALPGDPSHLSEDTPLVRDAASAWVQDKVAAEERYKDYLLTGDSTVTILRMALLLGPTISTFMTDYLRRTAVPVVMGLDPPVQFLNERDAAGSLHHTIRRDYDGPFNIVGDGALPLSVALRIGRRRSAPVPELGSYPLHQALWEPDIVEAPAALQDLFKYLWVSDGTRASQKMGYSPRHSTKETVEEFFKALRAAAS